MSIYKKLTIIQNELKAPKGQYNSFGKYSYRSCEDILEALKPLLYKQELSLYIHDSIESIGDRYYIKATCVLVSGEETISISAYAREEESKKGMDGAQVTGSSSSYARKYALNGLFLIDDTKDMDTDEYKKQTESADGSTNGCLSEKQIKRLYAVAKDCGFSAEDIKKSIRKKNKASAKELTKAEYDDMIEGMQKNKRGGGVGDTGESKSASPE